LLKNKPNVRLVYWWSFEVVLWLGARLPDRSFRDNYDNRQHFNRELVQLIVELFVDTFGDSGLTWTIANHPESIFIANVTMD
jgi:hypothetical protein